MWRGLQPAGRFGNVGPMNFAPSKLFHAVVITGAALTGCAGSAAQKSAAPTSTTSSPVTAPAPSDGGEQSAETKSGGTCPPGSERPYPPCYWIK